MDSLLHLAYILICNRMVLGFILRNRWLGANFINTLGRGRIMLHALTSVFLVRHDCIVSLLTAQIVVLT